MCSDLAMIPNANLRHPHLPAHRETPCDADLQCHIT
jgi:hypothetical protein